MNIRKDASAVFMAVAVLFFALMVIGGMVRSSGSPVNPAASSIGEESSDIEREQVPFIRGEQTIARHLREGSEAAQRRIAAMEDEGCPQLSIVKARQDMTAGDEKASEAGALMLDRHIGAAYYASLTASKRYARAESHAQGCLQVGGAQ